MKEKEEKLDLLLKQNTEEQLANVNWERLSTTIFNRLDDFDRSKGERQKRTLTFRIAAGIGTAVAVVFFVVMVAVKKPVDMRLADGRSAVVKFVETKGSAVVKIQHPKPRAAVMVHIGQADRIVAKCDVEIIDRNGKFEKVDKQAAWIIIKRSEPVFAVNGANGDIISMIYLF